MAIVQQQSGDEGYQVVPPGLPQREPPPTIGDPQQFGPQVRRAALAYLEARLAAQKVQRYAWPAYMPLPGTDPEGARRAQGATQRAAHAAYAAFLAAQRAASALQSGDAGAEEALKKAIQAVQEQRNKARAGLQLALDSSGGVGAAERFRRLQAMQSELEATRIVGHYTDRPGQPLLTQYPGRAALVTVTARPAQASRLTDRPAPHGHPLGRFLDDDHEWKSDPVTITFRQAHITKQQVTTRRVRRVRRPAKEPYVPPNGGGNGQPPNGGNGELLD